MTKIVAVLSHACKCRDQVGGAGFREIATRTYGRSFLGGLARIVLREDKDFGIELSQNSARRFQAIQLRHAYIHQDHIWPKFQCFLYPLATIASLTADFPVGKIG